MAAAAASDVHISKWMPVSSSKSPACAITSIRWDTGAP